MPRINLREPIVVCLKSLLIATLALLFYVIKNVKVAFKISILRKYKKYVYL